MTEPGRGEPVPAASASSPASTGWALFDAMGEHARARLAPTFDGAIGAAGGVLVAGGAVTVGGGDSASRGGVAAAAVVIIVAGAIARLGLDRDWRAVRMGAVALGAIGISALAATVPSEASEHFLRIFLLIATIGFVLAWLLPGYRGHPVMLGLGLLTLAGLLADLLASDTEAGFGGPFGVGVDELSVSVGRILLVAGVGYLVGVWFFDRRGYVGVGTAFAVAALLTTTIGAFAVASDLGDEGGSILLLAVGVAVSGVGARSDRRATAWWGAALAALGAGSLAVSLFEPESTGGNGAVVGLAGALMIAIATAITRSRRAPTAPLPPPAFAPPTPPSP